MGCVTGGGDAVVGDSWGGGSRAIRRVTFLHSGTQPGGGQKRKT